MPANLENLAMATGLEKVSFHSNPKESESESHSVMSDSLQPHGLYGPWNSPSQNTEVGSLSLLQQIFQTQESNQGLLHCRRILYHLSYREVKVAQSCLTLCNSMDYTVHGIL